MRIFHIHWYRRVGWLDQPGYFSSELMRCRCLKSKVRPFQWGQFRDFKYTPEA